MTELILTLLEKPYQKWSHMISLHNEASFTLKFSQHLKKKNPNIPLALLFIITQVLTNLNTKGVLDAKFSFISAFGNGFF